MAHKDLESTGTSGQGGTPDLLARLSELAGRPLAEATSMPREMYLSDDILALEKETIFEREWLCAGRTDDVPNPGDYRAFRIGDQPIMMIRGKDGEIRAFANVCRHRMMQLVEGSGNANRIVCPYHAWTYGTDGQLIGAPYMDKTACFNKKEHSLAAIRCEIWFGWVYVTLNEQAAPVSESLTHLAGVVERYRMEDYIGIVSEDTEWTTNWKLLCENFMEGYHLPVAHRATVGGFFPVEDTRFDRNGPFESFTYQTFSKTMDAPVGTAHAKNKHLKGKWRTTSVLPTIFPSHMITLAPDHFWYLSIQPNGVDRVSIRFGWALAPEVYHNHPNLNEFIEDTKNFLEAVQEEDRVVVEGIFRGAKAPLSTSGPLSWLERENHEFTQYVARRVTTV